MSAAVATGRWAWRQLTSMRTALVLLLLLAVAAVPGSILPQQGISPDRVSSYLSDHPQLGPWLQRLGFFDVYAAPWFAAVYLLLFLSLVGCIVPRTRVHLRNLRAAPPRTPSRLSRMPEHRRVVLADGRTAEQVLTAARAHLRRRRFRVAGHDAGQGGTSLAAERGYLGESANLVFHVALLGLLVSVGVGALYSWSGQALVVQGGGFSDTLPLYDSFRSGAQVDRGDLPPFSFSLDHLAVKFDEQSGGNQFGAPRDFTAALTVRRGVDAPAQRVDVKVNDPLSVGATRVYLVGNGYAPVLTVKDGRGQVAFSGPVPFLVRDSQYTSLGVVKVPDAQPRQIGLSGLFLPTAVFSQTQGPISVFPDLHLPRLAMTAWVGDLGLDSGRPTSVYQLDTSRMTQLKGADGTPVRILLAPGDSFTLPDGAGTVSFDGIRRYAAFDVHYDPSKTPVLVFAVLALVGLTVSLFVRKRRVWVRAVPGPDGRTVVEVAGLARGEDERLAEEVDALLAAGVPSAVAAQNSGSGAEQMTPIGTRE